MSLKDKLVKPDSVRGTDAANMFHAVAEEVIHGHRNLFDGLSLHEQEIVVQWLAESLVDGDPDNAIHDLLWELDFHTKPVDIGTFITDPYYMGKVAAGLGDEAESERGRAQGLHERWVEDLKEVFQFGSPYSEWIMTGAIGIGKTTIAMIALAYKLYFISCLRNPAGYYGLLSDSLMCFGIYSITKKQVADTGYYKLRGWLDSSPYFRFKFPRSKKIDSKVVFLKQNLQVIPGSQELHALGLDLFSFAMDEVNFMRAKHDKEGGRMVGQAYDLYNATHSRITSRFLRPGGTIPGIMLLMSSKNAQTSFLEELLKKRKAQGMGQTFVSDYPLWEVKPKHKFILPHFKVEVGDRVAPSRLLRDEKLDILEKYYDKEITDTQARKMAETADPSKAEATRKEAHVVTVPGEFLAVFKQDVDQALREVAGIATFNVSPLVRDRLSIFDSVREDLPNPFTRQEIVLSTLDEAMIEDYFVTESVCRTVESKWVPRLNPGAPRFAHVDLGLTGDCAGIAMGHVSGIVKNERTLPNGTLSTVENPFVIIDLMLRIRPPSGGEIDFSKIRSFLRFLKRMFPLRKVTLDGFQSADFMQIIRKPPFRLEAELLSVDRTEDPYLSLRSAHFDRRIGHYKYKPYEDEMLDLQRIRRANSQNGVIKWRVDHPAKNTKGGKGSKDVSDAVAGMVWLLMTDERSAIGAPIIDPEIRANFTVNTERVVDPAAKKKRPTKKRKRRVAGTAVDMSSLRKNLRS